MHFPDSHRLAEFGPTAFPLPEFGSRFDSENGVAQMRGVVVSRSIRQRLIAFVRNEDGVTAVECALMLALVVVVCLIALTPSPTPQPTHNVRIERQ